MYYVLTDNGVAVENIPEFDPAFPGVPIDERFHPDFVRRMVLSAEAVPSGWLYDAGTGTFSAPPEPEPVEPIVIPPSAEERIAAALEFQNIMAIITSMEG